MATVTDVTSTFGRARKVHAFSVGNVAAAAESITIAHGLGVQPAYVLVGVLPGISDADHLVVCPAGGVAWSMSPKSVDAVNVVIRKENVALSASVNQLLLVRCFREFPLSLIENFLLDLATTPAPAPQTVLPPWMGGGGGPFFG